MQLNNFLQLQDIIIDDKHCLWNNPNFFGIKNSYAMFPYFLYIFDSWLHFPSESVCKLS